MLSRNSPLAIALAWVLVGQPLQAAERNTDLSLMRNIQRAVESSAYFSVFDDVEIDIDDEGIVVLTGHVTLTGLVDSEADRTMAGILASNTAALSLTNDLRISSEVSPPKESLD